MNMGLNGAARWHAGRFDADCAIWDHVVQLFACCEEGGSMAHCDKCDATVWLTTAEQGGQSCNSLFLSWCE